MRLGLACLVVAYGLSQFYRAFLAVLTGALQTDVGAGPDTLSLASGVWFLVFAGMQIPVGAALDRFGPRVTTAALFAIGAGGGALLFSLAQTPQHVVLAMGLIGVGCSPVLMASYYIFARVYPAAVFATLAGLTVGVGSLGNIAGSAPMAWAVETYGWRPTMAGLALFSVALAVVLLVTVRDPERLTGQARGSVLDLLRDRRLWPILALMFVSYAPAAGLRGLWVGPYVGDVFAADALTIGRVTLVMGLAMIAGSFAFSPLDRVFGTRKGVILVGNAVCLLGILALIGLPATNLWLSTAILSLIGFAGMSYAMIVAHARAFFPPHLTGRGVTLVNLFSIGGAGVMQLTTGPIWSGVATATGSAVTPHVAVFAAFAVMLALGIGAYLFAQDRTD